MKLKRQIAALLFASVAMLGLAGCDHHHHHDHYPPPPPPPHGDHY
ncbi:hypothetical protein [Granulicella sp. L46]|nr:hypothetical protein [Granulicella sp. L46]